MNDLYNEQDSNTINSTNYDVIIVCACDDCSMKVYTVYVFSPVLREPTKIVV